MYSTINAIHDKVCIKFECLNNIYSILSNVLLKIPNTDIALDMIQNKLDEVWLDYSKSAVMMSADVSKTVYDEYKNFIIHDRIIDKLDYIYLSLFKIFETLCPIGKYSTILGKKFKSDTDINELLINTSIPQSMVRINLINIINNLQKTYQEQKIIFNIERIKHDQCNLCGSPMTVYPEQSEIRCDNQSCGNIIILQGVVFDDPQFYSQQNIYAKAKRYDPNNHCAKWLDRLLANEDYVFPNDVITKTNQLAINEYMSNKKMRPMINLKCSKIRSWLQSLKYVKYYKHAPLLRKIITGLHGTPVCPPILSQVERDKMLIEYSLCMVEFEKVTKNAEILRQIERDKISNKFYYPDFLWRLINLLLKKNDPRRKPLLECIYLQSPSTLVRNDIIWKEICAKRGYVYVATDSNIIS